ncbi:undecaprenyldiphospho-muramoylpentapeptide beta-N-acetylglucosaminyltransferase [Sulfurimonas sp. HSL-1716]|uniref:undecaprenyldiphospho-muramoylpentapeptide beta-N-acetylglucosaminyltransferase n=1 Tax=Hydrocurvibacter sulfurireducens TaxID=3131937 RepID=UPI0031F838CC
MKFCITGGGTGGHLSIAEALCSSAITRGHEVVFIGSTNGQDRAWFGEHSGFSHTYFLETSGVVNKKGAAKVKALYHIFKAVLESRRIFKRHKIQAVISVGGFSAAPAAFASVISGLPLFIHEQNAVVGRLNSVLRSRAKYFISAYEKDSPIKGYPVKELFFSSSRVREELKTIIFLGGSQGAKAINDLALQTALSLKQKGINIIHQCGERDFKRVKEEYEKIGVEVELYSFTKDLNSLVSRADLAVSRAGASTLWELCANGLPAFFIPYPYAAGDHQFYNANFIVKKNMGWCEREGEDLKEKLLDILDEPLQQKSEKLIEHSHKNVAEEMIKLFESAI